MQMQNEVKNGIIPVTNDEAVQLGAAFAYSRYGSYKEENCKYIL